MKKVVVISAFAMALSANCDSVFDGLYFGAGAMFGFAEDTAKAEGTNLDVSRTMNRLMGTLILGSGRAMNSAPLYFGGEVLLDLGKRRKEELTLNGRDMNMINRGIIPSFGLRLGYTRPDMDMLFFAKFALTYARTSLEYGAGKVTVSKFFPTVAFGLEKSICSKYSVRFDLEYVVKGSKSNSVYKAEHGGSLNLRAICTYNVKF